MSRILKWILLAISAPIALLIMLYGVTLISQIWPEPISETFESACQYQLEQSVKVKNRKHSYSNYMRGVWYTDHGELFLSKDIVKNIYDFLSASPDYSVEEGAFKKHIVGKVLASCSIDLNSGRVKYGLVLW